MSKESVAILGVVAGLYAVDVSSGINRRSPISLWQIDGLTTGVVGQSPEPEFSWESA